MGAPWEHVCNPSNRPFSRREHPVTRTLQRVLFLSVHAVKRMRQRRIERSEVLEALGNRETVYVSADDPTATVILGRTEQGRRLKVVVNSRNEEHIITVADRGQED